MLVSSLQRVQLDSHIEIMELNRVALVVGAGKKLGLTDVKLLM